MGFARSTARHGAAITSCIFGMFYLMVLTIMAVFRTLRTKSTTIDRKDRLPPNERRLVFDLGYYIRLAGFDMESHTVETEDGFLLDVNRIVDKPDASGGSDEKQKYPVLLIPGLMQASAAYCTAGPDALALSLARAGYDVWLGNNRGGFKPRHIKYSTWSFDMWNWCIRDMAGKDVPAMVEYVKKQTHSKTIAIGAHSQGTSQTFLSLSKQFHPELGTSVSSFSALAPAVYAGPLVDRWFLKLLRMSRIPYRTLMGYRAFLGIMGLAHEWMPLRAFTLSGYIMFHYMLGWNDRLWDRRYRDRNFIFAPTYVSSKHMMWWLGKGGFADTKCIFDESTAPWFDERFPPLGLFAPGRDDLVKPDRLINRIKTHEEAINLTVFDLPSYSHLDVLWAKDAHIQVGQPMAEFIWSKVPDQSQWRPVNIASV